MKKEYEMEKIKKLKYRTEFIDNTIEKGGRIEGVSYEYYNLLKSTNPLVDKINEIIEVLNELGKR